MKCSAQPYTYMSSLLLIILTPGNGFTKRRFTVKVQIGVLLVCITGCNLRQFLFLPTLVPDLRYEATPRVNNR